MKNLNERSVRILASLGLILTTMIWGFAFVVMKNSVDLIPADVSSGDPFFQVCGPACPIIS